ncbi:sperm acrosome-associated protein 5-like [Suncus etruscus]|uniref:sperm acrosome-associated protein 5-like n=1 Tax=Suncus etruscus TaxID=109475 RepID=UPI0021108E61|nr:sperm acrosome-associated protein 5-like [Suncus etruscus]
MQSWASALMILTMMMILTVYARIYDRCKLAQKLENEGLSGFMGYSIEDWLCMAHYESGFDTSLLSHNIDGSSEYGIFQLNSAWWCDNGITPTHNLCHMNCQDLRNYHIKDDILCAKKIVTFHSGMGAWDTWTNYCSGYDLSKWTNGCHMHLRPN